MRRVSRMPECQCSRYPTGNNSGCRSPETPHNPCSSSSPPFAPASAGAFFVFQGEPCAPSSFLSPWSACRVHVGNALAPVEHRRMGGAEPRLLIFCVHAEKCLCWRGPFWSFQLTGGL